MADKAIHQMIGAYTTGCLDKENYIQFMNYVLNRGELPRTEMGELQNVIALIPSLLDLETPPEALKDLVAKRILEFEGELKTKVEEKPRADNVFSKISAGTTHGVKTDSAFTRSTNPENDVLKTEPTHEHQLDGNINKESSYAETAAHKKKSVIFPWAMFLLAVIAVVAVAFYFNNINQELKTEIASIQARLSGLQNEIASSNRFLNEHINLIEFFNNKNVEIINFQGSDTNTEFSGKLLISNENGEGLLQLKNIEPLSPDETYQLWLVNNTHSLSLGTIQANPDIEYYKISNIPQVDKKDVRLFLLTKENKAGSVTPQGKTYLFGAFSNTDIKANRRR